MKRDLAPAIDAYAAISKWHGIDVTRIEPFTDEGRAELLRQINRPAGERVGRVTITERNKCR